MTQEVIDLGDQTNRELYKHFLHEPMKGSISGLWKHRFEIWFVNGMKATVRKAQRYSHKNIKMGDLKDFVVRRVDVQGKPIRYIMEFVGENNRLIPVETRPKDKQERKTKKTKLREIPAGVNKVRIYYMDKYRTTLSVNGLEMTIYTPLLFIEKKPPIQEDITILVEHRKQISPKGTNYISGHIMEWNESIEE